MKNLIPGRLRPYQWAAALGVFLTSSALQAQPNPIWLWAATTDSLPLPDLANPRIASIDSGDNLGVSRIVPAKVTTASLPGPAAVVVSHAKALDPAIMPPKTTEWIDTRTGEWFNSDDWSDGVPCATSTAVVANGGTAIIEESEDSVKSGATAKVGTLTIGSVGGFGGTVIEGTNGILDIYNGLIVEANGALKSLSGTAAFVFNDGTVTNSGMITGSTGAIVLEAGGSVTNNASGEIEGLGKNSFGIKALKALANITNFGVISGGSNAIVIGAGGTITNETGASITATIDPGILITGGNETIVNFGAISGGRGNAIDATSSSGSTILTNAGTINGNVELGSGINTVTLLT
jgi:hypothetical protein